MRVGAPRVPGSRTVLGRVLLGAGLAVICCAIALFGYNAWVAAQAGPRAQGIIAELPAPSVRLDADAIDPATAMTAVEVDGAPYCGTLEIPALGLELPIADELNDALLATSPCRAAGSVYRQDLAIAGMGYEAHFGRLSTLVGGEEVRVQDLLGNTFTYRVDAVEILRAGNIAAALTATSGGAGDGALRLVVCDASGAVRLVVHCAA